MKKMILLFFLVWFGLTAFSNSVKANSSDYYLATISNVITNKIQGENVNVEQLMNDELKNVMNQFALDSLQIISQYLPVLLEGALVEMRLEIDKAYKCALLENSEIRDNDC